MKKIAILSLTLFLFQFCQTRELRSVDEVMKIIETDPMVIAHREASSREISYALKYSFEDLKKLTQLAIQYDKNTDKVAVTEIEKEANEYSNATIESGDLMEKLKMKYPEIGSYEEVRNFLYSPNPITLPRQLKELRKPLPQENN